MPTIRALRRKCQPRPQDKPPSYVIVEQRPPPVVIPDPATLPMHYDQRGRASGMRYQREKLYALAMSSRFFEWLVLLAAAERVPLDDVLKRLEGLATCLEIHLMARVTWPHLFPREWVEVDDEPEGWTPRTEADALEAGLGVRTPREVIELAPANLPGCHGTPDGRQCNNLRRFGEKFCPSCRRRELQRMRNAVTR